MKNIIKFILPEYVRVRIRNSQKFIIYKIRRQIIKIPIFLNIPINIIVGAAMTSQSGWYSTNEQWLNIHDKRDWDKIFRGKCLIKNVLAEHVFEHLTDSELAISCNLIYRHLVSGGRLRIAVPDGYNPDPIYINHVGIAGIGADAADHKQLLNYDSLKFILEKAGFSVELIEGYRSSNQLVQLPINPAYGYVFRSRGNTCGNLRSFGWDFVDANTSLVMDGIKSK